MKLRRLANERWHSLFIWLLQTEVELVAAHRHLADAFASHAHESIQEWRRRYASPAPVPGPVGARE